MSVYLVQHGKAYDESVDPERSLTPEGLEETRRVARLLAKIGARPAKIYHSGKKRARQTAEVLGQALGAPVEEAPGLGPNDDPAPWRDALNRAAEDVMIVGHLPHLSRLASALLVGDPAKEVVRFRYSAVLKLERAEAWRIAWLITPDLA